MMVTSSPQPLDEDNVLLSSFNNTCSPDYEWQSRNDGEENGKYTNTFLED
jgi:hypothetical protein